MCIQYTKTVKYTCGHNIDQLGELVPCAAVDNGEQCAGTDEHPAPSETERDLKCPDCIAAASAVSASTEPESDGQDDAEEDSAQEETKWEWWLFTDWC